MSSTDLVARLSRQYTGVIADVLDQLGYRDQIMDGRIQALKPDMTVAGVAFTCKGAQATHLEPDDWDMRKAFLDAVPDGSILVVDSSGDDVASHWGELMATGARGRGGQGVVIDGGTRDVAKLLDMDFPTFARYRSPASSITRWRMSGFDHPVTCGGVLVRPGDIVVGDMDGVVVVPADAAGDVADRAEEIARAEDAMRRELLDGGLFSEVYDRYQVG